MAIKMTRANLGDLVEMDIHPMRNMLKALDNILRSLDAERKAREAERKDLIEAINRLIETLPEQLARAAPAAAPRQDGPKRLTVHRNRGGFIESIDVEAG